MLCFKYYLFLLFLLFLVIVFYFISFLLYVIFVLIGPKAQVKAYLTLMARLGRDFGDLKLLINNPSKRDDVETLARSSISLSSQVKMKIKIDRL